MGESKIKTKQFLYRNLIKWKSEKRGLLSAPGRPDLEIAAPVEFKGHEGIWTPEDLFVASVNSCIMTTFLHYAQRDNFNFLRYESQAEGVLELAEGRLIFSVIEVRPVIFIKRDLDIQKAKALIELSEKNCLISNSMKCEIKVLPEVKIEL